MLPDCISNRGTSGCRKAGPRACITVKRRLPGRNSAAWPIEDCPHSLLAAQPCCLEQQKGRGLGVGHKRSKLTLSFGPAFTTWPLQRTATQVSADHHRAQSSTDSGVCNCHAALLMYPQGLHAASSACMLGQASATSPCQAGAIDITTWSLQPMLLLRVGLTWSMTCDWHLPSLPAQHDRLPS